MAQRRGEGHRQWQLTPIEGQQAEPVSLILGVNPVYENGRSLIPDLDRMEGIHVVSRHLKWRAPRSGEATPAALAELEAQARGLVQAPRHGKAVIVSTDGASGEEGAGGIWRDAIRRVAAQIPHKGISGIGLEVFGQGASRHLRTHPLRQAQDLDRAHWRNRARGAAEGAQSVDEPIPVEGDHFQGRYLTGWSPTYGLLATEAHSIPAYFEWVEEQGGNLVRLWCIEIWTGLGVARGERALSPWEYLGNRQWDLHQLSERFFDRLQLVLEER